MKLLLVAALLSLGCASVPRVAPRWSAALQRSVFGQCYQVQGSAAVCSCYAFALEQFSPDPETPFTERDFAKANAVCGADLAEPLGSEAL